LIKPNKLFIYYKFALFLSFVNFIFYLIFSRSFKFFITSSILLILSLINFFLFSPLKNPDWMRFRDYFHYYKYFSVFYWTLFAYYFSKKFKNGPYEVQHWLFWVGPMRLAWLYLSFFITLMWINFFLSSCLHLLSSNSS